MENRPKQKKLKYALFALIFIIGCISLPKAFAESVPKSETIIIPGQLNDSREHALPFDHETEYVYGNAPEQTPESQLKQNNSIATALFSNFSKNSTAIFSSSAPAWRKTSFDKKGTLVITLSFEESSEYDIEVYNSCSNTNYCNQYEFGRFKTCTLNIEPGEFYFKIINTSGEGKYFLDVDLIENKQVSGTTASNCAKIACSKDTDCGTDTTIGGKYCKDNSVFQKKNKFFCNNPRKENAFCSNTEEEKLIEKCAGNCSNGACEKTTGFSLSCPTEPISKDYSFTWNKGQFTKYYIEFSSKKDFPKSISSKYDAGTGNSFNIAKKIAILQKYEKQSSDKQLFARIIGIKGFKSTNGNICSFTLEQENNLSKQQKNNNLLEILWGNALFSESNPLQRIATENSTLNFSASCNSGNKCKETDITGYQNSDCSWKELEYCFFGCNNGKCNETTCTNEATCLDSKTKATRESNCALVSLVYCQNACSNGKCINNGNCSPGNKCEDFNTAGYQNKDCSWQKTINCSDGCSNGKCNPNKQKCSQKKIKIDNQTIGTQWPDCSVKNLMKCDSGRIWNSSLTSCIIEPVTVSKEWKCKTEDTKGFQNSNGSWSYLQYCQYGCSKGECLPNPTACKAGYKCNSDGFTRGYQKSDCSWDTTKESFCINGCYEGKCQGTCVEDWLGNCESSCFNGWYCLYNNTKALMASDCSYTQKTKCPEAELGIGQCKNNNCICDSSKKFCSKENGTEYSVRRNTDCTIAEKNKCDYGCGSWGKCNFEIKWFCTDQKTKAVQNKDGSISGQTNCPNGCIDGNCIECNNDSDCGEKTLIDNQFCKNDNVFQKYKISSCENPRTTSSKCVFSESTSMKEKCNNGCTNGECNACSTGWKCKDSTHEGYRNKNCTWSSVNYCKNGCSDGECNDAPEKSCTNECSLGETRCSGSNKQSCGNFDDDSCKEWGNDYYCNNGCSNGQCKTQSNNSSPTSHYYSNCYNDNLYWFNSLGQREEIKQECSDGCSNNKCNPITQYNSALDCSPEHPCQAGQGNCSKNNDCIAGLRCIEGVGKNYNYSSNINVCEAPENIFNKTGWTCKNPNTMAYLLSDGTWSNELSCKHGCSNGSCFMPPICDSTIGSLEESKSKPADTLLFSERTAKEKTAYFFYQEVAVTLIETIFSNATKAISIGAVAILGQIYIQKTQSNYSYFDLPSNIIWKEGYLEKHYQKHVIEQKEWDYTITKTQYKDQCKRAWESKESQKIDQTGISTTEGDFAAYLESENLFVAINKNGEMITCFKPINNKGYIESLFKRGAKALPFFPKCSPMVII